MSCVESPDLSTVLGKIPHLLLSSALGLLGALLPGCLTAAAPVIDSFSPSSTVAAPGDVVTLTVTAHDPDCPSTCTTGCGLYLRADLTFWSATGGSFVAESNGTNGSPYSAGADWQAPAIEGTYTLSVSLSDSATFLCGGRQTVSASLSVLVTTVINQPPVISSLSASRALLFPGETSDLTCVAADPDGDPVTYSWRTNAGTVTPGGGGTALFTAGDPAMAVVTCTATDSGGAFDEETVLLSVTGAVAEKSLRQGLATPQRLAVDVRGDLYVADPAAGGIAVVNLFSDELVYRIPWPGIRSVDLDWAEDLLVGSAAGAQVIDRRGLPVRSLAADVNDVADVAVDRLRQRYAVLHRGPGRVMVYDAAGLVISAFGSAGDAAEELQNPQGLTFTPAGEIVVADSGHGLVKVYDPMTGALLSALGGPGNGVGELVRLDDVAVSAAGIIYASDSFQDWVQSFNPDGSVREVLGTLGSGLGEFRTPTGLVAADAFERLVVASYNSSSLQVFQLSATPTAEPAPLARLSASAVVFPPQAVGTASAPRSVLLTNAGTSALGLRNLAIHGAFTRSGTCGAFLDPATSCAIDVTFTPQVVGSASGRLEVDTSVPGAPEVVSLSGSGFLPGALRLSRAALFFSDRTRGTTSAPRDVILTNVGSVAVALGRIAVSGPFGLVHNCGAALAGGASCTLSVVFAPNVLGDALAGAVTIDNSVGGPLTLALEGRGIAMDLTALPEGIDFGPENVGDESRPWTLVVANTGTNFVNVAGLSLGGADPQSFRIATEDCSGRLLRLGETCTLELVFSPGRRGDLTADLLILSNADDAPDTVALLGFGIDPSLHEIPTLGPWGLGLLAALVGLAGTLYLRRSRHRAVAVLALAAALPLGTARAQDPPHWAGVSVDIDCTNQCHLLHQSPGGALTSAAGNVNVCQSCHNSAGLAADLPIPNFDKAVRDVSGTSHAFDVAAVNPDLDTQLPLNNGMLFRVMGGNVVCSTCHNQHRAESALGGTPRVGNAKQITVLGSTGTLASGGLYDGPLGVWYLVEIVQGGNENNARFCFSKDSGISWFPSGCNPPGTTNPNLTANGATPVALNNGVTASFGAGSFVAGERWEFSAAWPFLRAELDAVDGGSALCRDCHRSWVMDHTAVEVWDGNPKSHPVGVALNDNNQGYDRAAPLDGNGVEQGQPGADANPTNDLGFDNLGNVQCLTCHGVHFVDSNTETVDVP